MTATHDVPGLSVLEQNALGAAAPLLAREGADLEQALHVRRPRRPSHAGATTPMPLRRAACWSRSS